MTWVVVDRSWLITFLMVRDARGVPRSPKTAAYLRRQSPASAVSVVALAESHTSLAVFPEPDAPTAPAGYGNGGCGVEIDSGDGMHLYFVDLNDPGAADHIRRIREAASHDAATDLDPSDGAPR
jgi:hypothetical protein